MFFKYHWLSSLAIPKDSSQYEINKSLLDKSEQNNNNNNAELIDINNKSNNNSVNSYEQIQIKHNNNNSYNNMYNNNGTGYNMQNIQMQNINPYIQMQNMQNMQQFNYSNRNNSQPIPSQYNMHMKPTHNIHNHSMASIGSMNAIHNIGLSGYNPPLPKEQSKQEFSEFKNCIHMIYYNTKMYAFYFCLK